MLFALAAGARGQSQDVDRVKLRVNSSHPGGKVVIDRGKRDLVEVGDRVELRPRGGKILRGSVIEVVDRHSLVQLNDKTAQPDPGTRGEVMIPKSRGPEEKPTKKPDKPTKPEKPGGTEKPVFKNKDEKWQPGMPLLGQGKPVRPAERPARLTGRIYSTGLYSDTERSSNNDSYFRAGTDLEVENPFGRGGGFHFDAEFSYRTELNDNSGSDLILHGLSYYEGGSRFDSYRLEIGRFLQRGIPEFQVLDGIEWGTRRKNGDRYGASIGFLPEPDEDYESMEDFQIAAFYEWVFGEREDLTISGALQKTWHNGADDRDLLVAKVQYVPPEAWHFVTTLWIDYYDGDEVAQNSGVDLTQAYVSYRRHWKNGDGVDLTWRRVRFADIFRNEFLPQLAGDLADNRFDRASLTSWLSMTEETRFRSEFAAWDDEEDSGGSVELAIESRNVFTNDDSLDVALIGSLAQPSSDVSGIFLYSIRGERGAWDVEYTYGRHHFRGFPPDRDDLVQHRLRASRSFYSTSGWDVTVHAGLVSYDSDTSYMLGFYLQKGF